MALSKSRHSAGLQVAVPCDLCDTDAPGQHYCPICKQTLCAACKHIHEKVPFLRNHPVVPRAEIVSVTVDKAFCHEHTGELFSLYCRSCKTPICIKCVIGSHSGHSMAELGSSSEIRSEDDDVELSSDFAKSSGVATVRRYLGAQAPITVTQLTCEEHVNIEALYYCETCNIQVCTKCVTHKHRGHQMEDIAKKIEQARGEIEADVANMESKLLPKCIESLTDLRKGRDGYKKDIAKIRREMDDEVEAMKEEIDRCQNERLKMLREKETDQLKRILAEERKLETKKERICHEISLCKANLSKCTENPTEFLRFAIAKNKLPTENSDTFSIETPNFQSRDRENVSDALGQLTFPRSPRQSPPLKVDDPMVISTFNAGVESSPSICLSKDGNIWIGNRKSRELLLLNFTTKLKRKTKVENRPFAIAMLANGDIVISSHAEDSRSVFRLTTDGTEDEVFDASPSYPEGLSVTRDQQVLICTADGRLLKCDPEKQTTKQIYKGSSTLYHAVELPNKSMCISDWGSRCVLVIDMEGNEIYKIKDPLGRTNCLPRGLAFDELGNIFFADHKNDCVYIVDQSRKVKELVGKSHGIQGPEWLIIDGEGHLRVTQDDGTISVVKYMMETPSH